MSVLADFSHEVQMQAPPSDGFATIQSVENAIKNALAPYFWSWFMTHFDDKIFTKKVLFVSFNIHVKDLKPLWIVLFGPQMAAGG